jgi:chromosome segregation ATPase
MTDFLQAAESAKALVRGFGALGVLAEAFEQAGRLQQTLDETGAALVTARAKLDEVQAQTAQIYLDAATIKAEAQAIHENAVQASQLLLDTTQTQVHAQAKELEEVRRSTAQSIAAQLEEANAAVSRVRAEQLAAEKAAGEANAHMDALRAQVAALSITI